MINLTLKATPIPPVLTLKIKEEVPTPQLTLTIKQEIQEDVQEVQEERDEQVVFTDEEIEFIRISAERGLPVSRIAYRLGKDYDDVELQMVELGIVTQKEFEARLRSKYATKDEIDYKLLLSGNSETEIRSAHEKARLFPTRTSVGGGESDE